MNSLSIAGRSIGPDFSPVVVAEIGINHGGSIEQAIKLAEIAIDHGAEIIKHQTHIPDKEMSQEAKFVKPGNADESIYEVIKNNSLTLDEEIILANFVRDKGVTYMSTPFSIEAVDFLEELDVPAYKIGSGECNNYPFVEYVASKQKPIILSTGMNSIETIKPAVDILRHYNVQFALLHCTNLYPTPDHQIRLNAMTQLQVAFPDAVSGLSDHSLSNYPCLAAVSLGASILERHFTDSKNRVGPDIICSMTPTELSELIRGSEIIWNSMNGEKFPVSEESVTKAFAFSSVVANVHLKKGDILTTDNIRLRRPSGGHFGPRDYKNLIGKTVLNDIPENTQVPIGSIDL